MSFDIDRYNEANTPTSKGRGRRSGPDRGPPRGKGKGWGLEQDEMGRESGWASGKGSRGSFASAQTKGKVHDGQGQGGWYAQVRPTYGGQGQRFDSDEEWERFGAAQRKGKSYGWQAKQQPTYRGRGRPFDDEEEDWERDLAQRSTGDGDGLSLRFSMNLLDDDVLLNRPAVMDHESVGWVDEEEEHEGMWTERQMQQWRYRQYREEQARIDRLSALEEEEGYDPRLIPDDYVYEGEDWWGSSQGKGAGKGKGKGKGKGRSDPGRRRVWDDDEFD